jgi:hypothetical protein
MHEFSFLKHQFVHLQVLIFLSLIQNVRTIIYEHNIITKLINN